MKTSERIEIVGTILAILVLVSLFQSPSLNTVAFLMAIRLIFRYAPFKRKTTCEDLTAHLVTEVQPSLPAVIGTVIDGLCSLAVTVGLLSIPAMVLYLISPYQTLNLLVGATLGVAFTIAGHKRIFRLARIWVWFVTFNLSIAFVMLVKGLSR